MRFYQRLNGTINADYANCQPGFAEEELPDDHPDVVAYFNPAPAIPDRVTARQFKLQLLADGLLDPVEAWIASQDRAIQVAYANSGTFVRDEPMLQAGFSGLGLTEEQGDAFFLAAASI